MFTRISNFTYGAYRIANIDTIGANNNIDLRIHIQKNENECLRLILGECLYRDLMTNVELDTEGYYKLKSGADPKYDWLLNGHEYEDPDCTCDANCTNKYWQGLVREVAKIEGKAIYETVMSSYVYFNWSLAYRTLNLGVGEGKGTAANTTEENTKHKRVDAWNKLVQDVAFGFQNANVSLFEFLDHFKDDYPTAERVCFKTMTYYDI
jgi:hypothetical protein